MLKALASSSLYCFDAGDPVIRVPRLYLEHQLWPGTGSNDFERRVHYRRDYRVMACCFPPMGNLTCSSVIPRAYSHE